MSIFVDSSAWYAAADRGYRYNAVAKRLLQTPEPLVTSDHVVVETWRLVHHFLSAHAAKAFWGGLRRGVATIEQTTSADLEAAWAIGERFADEDFSLVDRTSFAVMERLGISRVISFDNAFAVYRCGPNLRTAFEVQR
ncbi:MAG: PIN domain-containing protein [Bryobacterales bacterium]|nr:PIN domain-containing protein [Bryobacterales bacterium]